MESRYADPLTPVAIVMKKCQAKIEDLESKNPTLKAAVDKKLAAGVSVFQIITALLPFVEQALSGGTINIAALMAAIEALFPTPAK
jgi:hypothetical protein